MREKKRATTHGQQDIFPLTGDSLAEHLGGRLASALNRIAALMNCELSTFCADGHMDALRGWPRGSTYGRPSRDARSINQWQL